LPNWLFNLKFKLDRLRKALKISKNGELIENFGLIESATDMTQLLPIDMFDESFPKSLEDIKLKELEQRELLEN
jgi:hypothetical protein